MRLLCFVALPLLLQLAVSAILIAVANGKGSFVGLGVMLIGLWAIPGTALINFLVVRARPPMAASRLALRVLLTSTIYPLAMTLLYAVAS